MRDYCFKALRRPGAGVSGFMRVLIGSSTVLQRWRPSGTKKALRALRIVEIRVYKLGADRIYGLISVYNL